MSEIGDIQANIGSFYFGISFWVSVVIAVFFVTIGIGLIVYGLRMQKESCLMTSQCIAISKNQEDVCDNGLCKIAQSRQIGIAIGGSVLIFIMVFIVFITWIERKLVNTNRTTQQIGGAFAEVEMVRQLFKG